jgi:uncharacterized protein involved in response to NO
MAIVILSAAALLVWVVRQDGLLVGILLTLMGVLHIIRLGRWAGDRTSRERLVLILHIGYAFIPAGFLLAAAAALDFVPPSAGIHAWMAGAAGVMTLAVMTRASLGHTGQQLVASPTTQGIYVAIVIAALARICAVIVPAWSGPLLHMAAFAWAAAFLGFAVCFGPALMSEKRH